MGRDNGATGNGDQSTSVITPQQIVASGVKEIAAGGNALFIKSDGLWGMGGIRIENWVSKMESRYP